MEQEKYGLRRKLDSLEGEYESRVSELQTDLKTIKKELEIQQNYSKQTETEKNKIIQELIEQNHRLTKELKQVRFFNCFIHLLIKIIIFKLNNTVNRNGDFTGESAANTSGPIQCPSD